MSSSASFNCMDLEEEMTSVNHFVEGDLKKTLYSMLDIKLLKTDEDIQFQTSEKIAAGDSKVMITESDVTAPVIVTCENLREDVDVVETVFTPTAEEPRHQRLFMSSAASLNYEHLEEPTRCDNYLDQGSLTETYRSMSKINLSTLDEVVQSPTSEKIVVADTKVLIDESDVPVPVIVACEDSHHHMDGTETEVSPTAGEPCHQTLYLSSAASSNYAYLVEATRCDNYLDEGSLTETEISLTTVEPGHQLMFIYSAASSDYECLVEATRRDDYLYEGSLTETYRSISKNKLSTIDEEIESLTSENIVEADSNVLIDESNVAVPVITSIEDLHQDGDGVEIDTVVSSKTVNPKRQSLWSRTKTMFQHYLCCCCYS